VRVNPSGIFARVVGRRRFEANELACFIEIVAADEDLEVIPKVEVGGGAAVAHEGGDAPLGEDVAPEFSLGLAPRVAKEDDVAGLGIMRWAAEDRGEALEDAHGAGYRATQGEIIV
jgi:hypothetical protein